ncbi:hypothetical protein BHM03_00053160, partial [Ensete ventricosum]
PASTLLPPLPHFQPSIPCFTLPSSFPYSLQQFSNYHRRPQSLPSPSTASSFYPKEDMSSATSVPPLLIYRWPAFGSTLPLPSLPPVGRCYPSPACYHSAPVPLPQLPLSSLFLPFLPRRCLLIAAIVASPTSLTLNRAFLPPHLHHRHYQLPDPALPNPFPTAAAITGHNRCPSLISSSTSSVAIAASPHCCHLSPVVAATHRCASSLAVAALAATTVSNHALVVVTLCYHYCPHHLQLAFRYISDSYTDNLIATKSYNIYDANLCP